MAEDSPQETQPTAEEILNASEGNALQPKHLAEIMRPRSGMDRKLRAYADGSSPEKRKEIARKLEKLANTIGGQGKRTLEQISRDIERTAPSPHNAETPAGAAPEKQSFFAGLGGTLLGIGAEIKQGIDEFRAKETWGERFSLLVEKAGKVWEKIQSALAAAGSKTLQGLAKVFKFFGIESVAKYLDKLATSTMSVLLDRLTAAGYELAASLSGAAVQPALEMIRKKYDAWIRDIAEKKQKAKPVAPGVPLPPLSLADIQQEQALYPLSHYLDTFLLPELRKQHPAADPSGSGKHIVTLEQLRGAASALT